MMPTSTQMLRLCAITTLLLPAACAQDGDEAGIFAKKVSVDPGAEPPTTYISYQAPQNQHAGSLRTGISRWYHGPSDTTLFLVGVLHIGEQEYYDQLQKGLDSCDLVLFEGVGKGSGDQAPSEADLASMDLLLRMQIAMKDALDLIFQKDGIDYERSFWRNADMDFPSLQARMKELGTGLPTDNPMLRMILDGVLRILDPTQVRKHPKIVQNLRRQMAPALAMADEVMQRPAFAKMGQTIITERNAVVMGMLERELAEGPKGRRIALFYGAGHLPDLTRRLEKAGCSYEASAFYSAWTIAPKPAKKR